MLKQRLISGILIGLSVLWAATHLPALGEWILLLTISSFAQLEFYAMLKQAGIPSFRYLGVLAGGAMISATFFTIGPEAGSMANSYRWENIVLLTTLLAVFVRQFPQKYNDKPIETIACTLLGIWYVPFMFNFFTRLAFAWDVVTHRTLVSESGRMLCLYLIFVVKCTDVGAYFTGRLLGRHKLFPRISPNKTWEGFFGGMALALAVSLLFMQVCNWHLGQIHVRWIDAVILGLLLSVVGTVGDMFESLLKRAATMKDSSSLVPGMGGMLDVLDSLLFGAPVLYAYASYMRWFVS